MTNFHEFAKKLNKYFEKLNRTGLEDKFLKLIRMLYKFYMHAK